MKYPKKIVIKCKNGEILVIELLDVKHLDLYNKFEAKIEISDKFIESKFNEDTIEFITEEKELPEPKFN